MLKRTRSLSNAFQTLSQLEQWSRRTGNT